MLFGKMFLAFGSLVVGRYKMFEYILIVYFLYLYYSNMHNRAMRFNKRGFHLRCSNNITTTDFIAITMSETFQIENAGTAM